MGQSVSQCMAAMCSYYDVAVAGGVSGSRAESTAERPPCLGTSSIKKAQLSSVPIVTLFVDRRFADQRDPQPANEFGKTHQLNTLLDTVSPMHCIARM